MKSGRKQLLKDLGTELGGPLGQLWIAGEQQDLVGEKQFAAAEAVLPPPELQNIATPSIETNLSFREKAGTPGTSRLREIDEPGLEGVIYESKVDRISIDVERQILQSDALAPGQAVGRPPLGGAVPYSFRPTTDIENATTFHLDYQHSGETAPFAELGITPTGGPLSPLPVGRLGLLQQENDGYWSVEASGVPVQESLLSYTGIVDPYSGKAWGRVVDVGTTAKGYVGLGGHWGLYAESQLGWDMGDDVETNQHVSLGLSLSRDLQLPGFDYFTVGPSFLFEHYAHNLSGFTIGQGGYFSPDHLFEGTLGINFLTTEGKRFVLQGSFGPGVQEHYQDSSALYPLHPDGETTPSDTNSSFVFSSKLSGVILLASHWETGAYVGYAKSADYDDFQGGLFVRYLFGPRNGAFSTDLAQ